jgi:hypothetical protein
MKKDKIYRKIGIVIIGTSICLGIIAVIFLMNGKAETSTAPIANVKTTALRCESDNYSYPFFKYDNSNRKELALNLVFNENAVQTISLNYQLYYNNENSVTASEASNHAAMNISFEANGLGADTFNATYSKFKDRLKFSLYTQKIDYKSEKYFLIENTDDTGHPDSLESYKNYYSGMGFNCTKY